MYETVNQMNPKTLGSIGQACGVAAQKDTAASNCQRQFKALAARANDLADRAENALSPVSRNAPPESKCNEVAGDWVPPLFDDYRAMGWSIENSIRRIEDALDRLEI